MPSPSTLALAALSLTLAWLAAFLAYVVYRYCPIIVRIFEETPMFLPLRELAVDGGEDVRFTTADGLELAGTYFHARTEARAGVIVFCHEYLSDRWSFRPYADRLRDQGFDLFTFDFRNHGQSACAPGYKPLQWVTDHEVNDLRAAIEYLRSRPDHDPAGFGLFGVSRGGTTALLVAADVPSIWGVVTDGAFPTRGTMLAFILRWAEIFVGNRHLWKYMPVSVFCFVGWAGRLRSERRLNCRFPDVERAVARLTPRPWLMIHGEKDSYIGPEIVMRLFDRARQPKESWIVPGAKHNRCREVEPEVYGSRIASFFRSNAPRRRLRATSSAPSVVSPPAEGTPAVAARIAVRIPLVTLDEGLVAPVRGRT